VRAQLRFKVREGPTTFGGTVLRQDFRDILVSGISEVSGVTGDGEREQAVTEEEDMVALPKGKGGSGCELCPPEPDAIANPNPGDSPVRIGRQEVDSWRIFRW